MDGTGGTYAEKRNAYRDLFGNPEGKRQHGKSRHRRMYYIKLALTEIGWVNVNWI